MSGRLKGDALAILEAGVRAADPYRAVSRCLEGGGLNLDLDSFRRILLVGAGKAAARMARAAEEFLAGRLSGGAIVVKDGHAEEIRGVEVIEAAHPIPDERGLRGAERIASLMEAADENTLVLCLISGGGSALLPLPAPGVTLGEKQEVTRLLLGAGAGIEEINAVRKHLSAVKGGQLACRAAPARVVSLLLSDVVGDAAEAIASGPTVADPSTFEDARDVLARRDLWPRVPESVRQRIEAGLRGEVAETPKPGDPELAGARHAIIGSNAIALAACAEAARSRGYRALVLSSSVQGESREVARVYAAIAREIRRSGQPAPPPACVIAGGETTVTLRGGGKGGRNQELAVAAALDLAGLPGVLIASAGTDGTDGPTDAAGGVATGDSASRAEEAGLDLRAALDEHDAYPLLDRLGDLIRSGPTGTNVMDVHLVMVDAE